jgi:hypothetical protein
VRRWQQMPVLVAPKAKANITIVRTRQWNVT